MESAAPILAGISRPVKMRGMGRFADAQVCQMRAGESTIPAVIGSPPAPVAHARQEFLDLGQDAGNDHVDADRRGMNAVALVEAGVACNALEEKGIEHRVIFRGELRIDLVESARVAGAW